MSRDFKEEGRAIDSTIYGLDRAVEGALDGRMIRGHSSNGIHTKYTKGVQEMIRCVYLRLIAYDDLPAIYI